MPARRILPSPFPFPPHPPRTPPPPTARYVTGEEYFVHLAAGTLAPPLTMSPRLRAVIFQSWTASHHVIANVSADGLTLGLANPQQTEYIDWVEVTGRRVYFQGAQSCAAREGGSRGEKREKEEEA